MNEKHITEYERAINDVNDYEMTHGEIEKIADVTDITADNAAEMLNKLAAEYETRAAQLEETKTEVIAAIASEEQKQALLHVIETTALSLNGYATTTRQILEKLPELRAGIVKAGLTQIDLITVMSIRHYNLDASRKVWTLTSESHRAKHKQQLDAGEMSQADYEIAERAENVMRELFEIMHRLFYTPGTDDNAPDLARVAETAKTLKIVNNSIAKRISNASDQPLNNREPVRVTALKKYGTTVENMLMIDLSDDNGRQLEKGINAQLSGVNLLLHDAAFTLFKANGAGCFVTAQQIYNQAMQTGAKNNKTRPETLAEIAKDVEFMTRQKVWTNCAPEIAARGRNFKERMNQDEVNKLLEDRTAMKGDYLINASTIVRRTKRGEYSHGWVLNSFALDNDGINEQIVTVKQDLANVEHVENGKPSGKKIRQDLHKRAIIRYLYIRIDDMIATADTKHPQPTTIELSKVFRTGEITPSKEKDARTFIKQTLDYWKAKAFIKDYKITRRGGDPKIDITLTPACKK